MYCIKTDVPEELNAIDDECKAIYHSKDSFCVWTFVSREQRNEFVDQTQGMAKADRENFFLLNYAQDRTSKKGALLSWKHYGLLTQLLKATCQNKPQKKPT